MALDDTKLFSKRTQLLTVKPLVSNHVVYIYFPKSFFSFFLAKLMNSKSKFRSTNKSFLFGK